MKDLFTITLSIIQFSVFIAIISISSFAVASQLPDGIGEFKLGQRGVEQNTLANVTFEGYTGELFPFLSDKSEIETIRFSAFGCADTPDEPDCTDKIKNNFNLLRQHFEMIAGTPKTQKEFEVVWEEGDKRLTVGRDSTGGLGEEIAIYLEFIDETKVGGKKDGFLGFYQKFKQAVKNNDRNQLVNMMSFPFQGTCGISINNKKDFDGNLNKVFKSHNLKLELKEKPYFNRFGVTRMFISSGYKGNGRLYFSSGYNANGIGFERINRKWLAVGHFCGD
jgi:hypothetical protein